MTDLNRTDKKSRVHGLVAQTFKEHEICAKHTEESIKIEGEVMWLVRQLTIQNAVGDDFEGFEAVVGLQLSRGQDNLLNIFKSLEIQRRRPARTISQCIIGIKSALGGGAFLCGTVASNKRLEAFFQVVGIMMGEIGREDFLHQARSGNGSVSNKTGVACHLAEFFLNGPALVALVALPRDKIAYNCTHHTHPQQNNLHT